MADAPRTDRRALLRAAGAALATAPLGGCGNMRGSSEAGSTLTPAPPPVETVAVGPGGRPVYDPADLRVVPGTTVAWEWESDDHDIAVDHRPEGSDWTGHEPIEDAGFTHEHTFEVEGIYRYSCRPHRAAGMRGRVVVARTDASVPSMTRQRRTAPPGSPPGGTEPTVTPTATRAPAEFTDARGREEVTVAVGPGGELRFDPAALRIWTGTTVTWVWRSDNHNVAVGSHPEGSDWQGHDAIENAGYTYSHTFSVPGRYRYWCQPHEVAGMRGTLLVE